MALKQLAFSSKEVNNSLVRCWIAGERKLFTTNLKLLDRHEIATVNIVDCCNRIHKIIDDNQAQKEQQTCHQIEDPHNRYVAFKDITRLTFGLSYIHRQQVDTLLDDAKHLLAQMRGTIFNFDVVPTQICVNRKRKRVYSKRTTTTVCVSKRPRIMSPQLLDDEHVDYYRNMLTESQLWSKESEALDIKESQTTCTSERFISITQEVILTEIDQDLMWNDGFGEPNQIDQTALEEFLPLRNSLKRESPDLSASELCYKMPRLAPIESNIPSNEIELVCHIDPQDLNLDSDTERFEVHPVPIPCTPPVITVQSKGRKRRKCKLKIDKCIKLSSASLKEYWKFYKLTNTLDVKRPLVNTKANLLNSFRQSNLFPDRLRNREKITREQMEMDCEYTIRAIFDIDYSDSLANSILKNIEVTPPQINYLEQFDEPEWTTVQSPINDIIQATELRPTRNNNNNNNVIEHIQNNGTKNLDSFGIMMDLLYIWRKDPKIKSVDANNFVKSFPDRFKAALAFSHLLYLMRDGFIQVSKKLGSLQMDQITLGPESIKLIENI